MIKKSIEKALNEQLNKECFSSYLYLSMAAYFESQNFTGMASWMQQQAKEEWGHAMKIFNFLFERGGRAILEKIEKPKSEWKSALDAFQNAYKHEISITKSIEKILELAQKEKDYATVSFLQWFINEQVEEEATADKIVDMLKKAKESYGALFYIDKNLGKRGK